MGNSLFRMELLTDFSTFPQVRLEFNSKIRDLISPAHCDMGELRKVFSKLSNDKMLLSIMMLKEAKNSLALENVVSTYDSLYKHQIQPSNKNPATKAVYNYMKALEAGCKKTKTHQQIRLKTFLEVQAIIEPKHKKFRKSLETAKKNKPTPKLVYAPPLPEKIPQLMAELGLFIYSLSGEPFITQSLVPLSKEEMEKKRLKQKKLLKETGISATFIMDFYIKMSLVHHQFETIKPFYDGNEQVSRILNILYFVSITALDQPYLLLNQYLYKHREDYYKNLQQVKDEEAWVDWVAFMLKAISASAKNSVRFIQKVDNLFKESKTHIRLKHKFYSLPLVNNLFSYPYTTVKLLSKDIKNSKAKAAEYLDALAKKGFLEKKQLGKQDYYINKKLFQLIDKD